MKAMSWAGVRGSAFWTVIVVLLNVLLHLRLPGVSEVDIRPQIVILPLIGYLHGPLHGFLAGLTANLFTDLALGHGLRFFFSWTIGNGMLGALMGLFSRWNPGRIGSIGELAKLVVAVMIVNGLMVTYATTTMLWQENILSHASTFRFFYVPAILVNTLFCLLFMPALLFVLGQMKRTYPVKLALSNYYLTLAAFLAFGAVFHVSPIPMALTARTTDLAIGNDMVEAFSRWACLLLAMLLASFALSGWLANLLVRPLDELSASIVALLKGDASCSDRLTELSKRPDEVGLASFAVKVLGDRLLDVEKAVRHDLETNLKCLDPADSGSDLFTVALVREFGEDALRELWADETATEKDFTLLSAIRILVSLCGLRELATSYGHEQVARRFSGLPGAMDDDGISPEERGALAVAMDTGLLFKGRLKVLDPREPITRELALHLMERCRTLRGSTKNYVGFITEPDILGRMADTWDRMVPPRDARMEQLWDEAIRQRLVTGYIMKRLATLSCFDPESSIEYSHNSFAHMKQLLALLQGERLQARLQFEPVHSMLLFRPDWEQTPDLHIVTLANGDMLARKDDTVLAMEFASREDRDRFHSLIETHARRSSLDARPVLRDSWFQPLYISAVALPGYLRATRLSHEEGGMLVQCYVREEQTSGVLPRLQAMQPNLSIQCDTIWVNATFAHYLGEWGAPE